MRTSLTRVGALASLAVAAIVACSNASRAAGQSTTGSSGTSTPAAVTKADTTQAVPSPADVHFMTGMIGHHAQALVMAGWAPSHGASPAVRTLCERIVNEQQDEIVTMQRWLRDHGQPVPEAKPGPMKMMMNGMEHEMLMPGMLTDAQLKQLDAARGAEFDRLFLIFMIQHHKGAVSMVKDLFETYGAAQEQSVFKLASDVNVDQTTEIARMQNMLASLMFGRTGQ